MISSRHRVSSFLLTSNRSVEEWGSASSTSPSWATAPLTGCSTPATRSSSRELATEKLSPHPKLLGEKEVIGNPIQIYVSPARDGLMTLAFHSPCRLPLGNIRAEEASGEKNDRCGLLELLDMVAGNTLVDNFSGRLSYWQTLATRTERKAQ